MIKKLIDPYANIPHEMKIYPHWMVWRLEDKPGRAKPSKVPYSAFGGPGKTNDVMTWSSFDEAVSACQNGDYNGIGFVFTSTPFIAIDLDDCFDPETKQFTPEAAQIVTQLHSYTEYSQSGRGLHIICKGTLPPGKRRKGPYEMYGHGSPRYFAMTGNTGEKVLPIRECQADIDAVHAQYIAAKPATPQPAITPATLSDNELITKAHKARNGTRFSALWNGDTSSYSSASEADLALLNMLAFWTERDATRMDSLYRMSGLYRNAEGVREKWDRPQSGSTYGALQIDKAIAECRIIYEPKTRAADDFTRVDAEPTAKPVIIKASDVPYEPPRWLLPPYFQRGKGTLIQADNGTGKTAFMCAIAAHISTGRPLLDIPIQTPGDVLILSVEDDLPVLRGRIEANAGDLDKCHFITNAAGLTFNSPEVEQAVKHVNAKLVIFDPFQAFLGANINMDKSNQTRPELAKLFEMSDRNDCAVAIIAHIGKGSISSSAVNRSLGSVDIPSAMRSIFQIIRNPDDENECIAVHVKCSNAPKGQSIAYTIGDRGGVHWNGFNPMTVDDLSIITKRTEKGVPYDNEPLVQVFNQLIADKPGGGFWAYEELKSTGMKILGFPPFSSTNDLKYKLDGPLARELQARDGLIVTHGQRGGKGIRGIRIEQYQHPSGYQTSMSTEGDANP